MTKRSLSMILVVVALLLSAWGNVIAAAFCPRLALNHDCCQKRGAQKEKPVKHESSCHHEMADMEMDDMQVKPEADSASNTSAQNSQVEFASEASSEEVAVDLPIGTCAHCLSQSQPTSGTVSVVALDPSKRMVESDSRTANFHTGLTFALADLIVPAGHGPPGPSSPRHIIIGVFRI